MSIYLSEANSTLVGTGSPVVLGLPAGASFKGANVGVVTGVFIRTPSNGYTSAFQYNILTRGGGATGGSDGFVAINQAAGTITANFRNAGTQLLTSTTVTGLAKNTTYLVMLIATNTNTHLVACPVGGSPIITTVASTLMYSTSLAASDVWSRFGAGTSSTCSSHYGMYEEAFLLTGLFPESAGVPDNTLIQNIANGTQDLATLDAQLSSGVKKWRYRMTSMSDLGDSYGNYGSLTQINATTDKFHYSCGPLRPVELTPAMTTGQASQVTFATPLTMTGATADIKVEGGTYTGATPASIRARLKKEDGSVHVNWTVIDPAPTGGAWVAGQFTAVPATSGILQCEIAKFDSGGAQIGESVHSYGWKGTGLNIIGIAGQSQLVYVSENGNGMAIPSTIRMQVINWTTTTSKFTTRQINSAHANSRIGRGARQMAIEWNTLFPGYPISYQTTCVIGQGIAEWLTGGLYANTLPDLAAFMGVIQPHQKLFMGHSSGSDSTYETKLGNLVTRSETYFGSATKNVHAFTPRYAGAGTGGNYIACEAARNGIRNYCINNPTGNILALNGSTVKCETGDIGPHSAPDLNVGVGRLGAMLAWAFMAAVGAVNWRPRTIVSAVKISGGTQVKLVIGSV